MAKGLSDAELSAIIGQQIELAKSHDRAERATTREKALDYFLGNMNSYVPPETNRSKVVSRDVADTIGWTLPQIMRVFSASDKMAIAEPTSMEDVEFAKQATNGLNYVFWKDNDGEQILYDSIWDALLVGNAVVKTYYDDTPVYSTTFHSGLTQDQIALLIEDEDTEVLAYSESQVKGIDPTTGQPTPLFDIKIKRKKLDGTFVVDVIPPEEFLIDADAITTTGAAFTDHWQRKTRSALVEMGYSKDDVWAIPESARVSTPEKAAREPAANSSESTDKSMQLVDYHECFIRIDVDGDGEAELCRACYGGGQNGALLDWEVWEDEHPFDDIKCEPIPHRWLARSQADETIDIQDIKTVLWRNNLNNTYWVSNPQRFATGKINNPEALESPVFGGTVFGAAGSTVVDLPMPYIGDKLLEALAYADEVQQRRTGVGRQSMALDPDVLQNQTAAAVHDQHDAQYTQVEQYARNMAAGWRKVFSKLLILMIKHQDYSRKIMVNGKEAEIDPRSWNADMKVTINVGLGTGSRDRDLAMLGQVLQSQLLLADRFMQAGATDDAIDMLPKIIQTLTKMAESAGIKNPEDFYPEYTEQKVAALKQMAQQRAAQPDPKIQIEQGKLELAKTSMQSELQGEQMKAQAETQKSQAEAQTKMIEAQSAMRESQLQMQLAQAEIQIKRDQLQIQQMEIAAKNDNERWKAQLSADTSLKVAEIGAGNSLASQALEANLDSVLGVQDHLQALNLAEQAHQHALDLQASAPKPTAPAGP